MPFLQAHHIVDLYCWVDSIVDVPVAKKAGRPPALSESEVVTALIWGTIALKHKTLKDVYDAVERYHRPDFPKLPHYSTFVAEAHRASALMFEMLSALLSTTEATRIMDATMLPVCKPHRADDHKVAKNIAKFGKNWQGWHYGFKLHASVGMNGALCGLALTPANVHDAQAMPALLNKHARVAVGDTLYGASVMGRKIWETYGTVIVAPPHPKQQKKIASLWQIDLLNARSKIESVFDYLKEHLYLVSSFPRSVMGYVVHYVRVLLGYQILALAKGF